MLGAYIKMDLYSKHSSHKDASGTKYINEHPTARLDGCYFLSRGIKATELSSRGTCWRGPDFLGELEDSWPINKNFKKPTRDVKIKRSILF